MLELSGWDKSIVEKVAAHPLFQRMADRTADQTFHREDLLGPASLIPDEWIDRCSAVGSLAKCVAKLQEFKDAGADEIATYGSTPGQNAALLAAWRERSTDVAAAA
jgi:alkanesulfonate monooxygenase SsuD/methylene tetrahydromethanopterin reductase-like flavin-dependent oxidoreductase (luciferase family)